jgi:hypothetical protein
MEVEMKRAFILGLITLTLLMPLALTASGLDTAKVKADIRKNASYFLDTGAASADCEAAFLGLVGTVERAAPESGFPASFGKAVSEARELFESTSILNANGIRLLNDAYLAANDGRRFSFPKGLTGIESIRAHAGRLCEASLQDLDAGRTGAAVKSVLEILLMIVTPVQATN